jgi:predicted amidohydrolase
MIIDPLGQVLHSNDQGEAVLTEILEEETLGKIRENLPFLLDTDLFLIHT